MVSASSGRIFALGWWRRGPAGAGRDTLAVLHSGLEEPRDPVEGRCGRFGGGLALVDLTGMLTHGGENDGGGRWMVVGGSRVCVSVAACLELSGGGEAVQWR